MCIRDRYKKALELGTIVYISVENEFLGYIVISDKVKENAKEVISNFCLLYTSRCV